MKRLLASALLGLAAPLSAEPPPEAVPEPPTIPEPVQSGEVLEPEVTIVESDKGTIYEYRVHGRLYMVKIQPIVGPAYYLLDTDGDGQMDARQDRPFNQGIPQWVLFSW